MSVPVLGSLLETGLKVLDRVLPDKAARELARQQFKLELLRLEQAGELEIARQQTEVNKIEAAAPDLFRAGWRPFVGWTCGVGLAYQFVALPLLSWAAAMNDLPVPPPLDMGPLITLLGGMLGLGALRTAERMAGKA